MKDGFVVFVSMATLLLFLFHQLRAKHCTHQGQWEAQCLCFCLSLRYWNSDKSRTDALFCVFTSVCKEKREKECVIWSRSSWFIISYLQWSKHKSDLPCCLQLVLQLKMGLRALCNAPVWLLGSWVTYIHAFSRHVYLSIVIPRNQTHDTKIQDCNWTCNLSPHRVPFGSLPTFTV